MKKLRILLLFLVTMGLIIVSGCQNPQQRANTQDTWNKIQRHHKVVVGLDDSFVPMGFREKNGKLVGFDVDLAREVFKRYNINVDFQTIDWSMKETELRNGTIDLIWNGYTINPERKKTVTFSNTYLINRQVLVTKTKDKINNVQEMKGRNIGLQSGSSGYEVYEAQPKLLKKYVAQTVQYDTFNNALLDLNAGRIQGLLIDSVYANYYVAHEPNPNSYKIINIGFKLEDFAVGMRKGDKTLRNKINTALMQMAEDGSLQKLSTKWFGNSQSVPVSLLKQNK